MFLSNEWGEMDLKCRYTAILSIGFIAECLIGYRTYPILKPFIILRKELRPHFNYT
jgi:hypothetical protein